ncbi:type I restriction endonuclease subunit R [Avibacterium sp. 20-15]|uniref:type I restriction endonuclease subunit R n=1 Tax=unclassified Avibacterium TaxID=2685287 RepID=UPI002026B367|nr:MULTISPECIES: type I restriction endonuclease subunit R [unclassified Avibacterium]MCW9732310.1 type I restriction endonuclease subunit R [Avibacterium sp. 20-15]URL04477.1 type I restriction endonuclease subunit R [Avibacterium sp. 20-132]
MHINESTIENLAIEQLQSLGWQYAYGKEVLAEQDCPWRESLTEVVIIPHLLQSLRQINPHLPQSVLQGVVQQITQPDILSVEERNKRFYHQLKQGIKVHYQEDGQEKHDVALLVDFKQPENNLFYVVNQLEIEGDKGKRIPDILCFINGLPLVIFELKNPLDVSADLDKAFNQLQTYKREMPDLFVFNQLMVISDGTIARLGSLTADFQRFMPWRVVDESQGSLRINFENELSGLLQGLFSPQVLLDYLQSFVVFEADNKGTTVKKIAAYHQFYGVNAAVEATIAAQLSDSRKIGVVWHTQGSGKSLSMLFYAGKLITQPELKNPTIVVVTDRNDLDGQLFATFSQDQEITRQTPIQADDREALRAELAKRESGGIIFTTIQKFALREGELQHPVLNERHNIIVISDEAHRSQYGFSQKINQQGTYREGYAKYLRTALPNASFIGFTGTPVSLEDRDTQEVFGRYISIYDIQDAVQDGATVPIIYEARQIPLQESQAFRHAVQEAQRLLDDDEESYSFRLREQLMGTDERIAKLAEDLVRHFERRTELEEGKAMAVVMSRKICVKLYDEIIKLRPHWHSDDINQGAIKIMMTGNASDPETMQKHIYTSQDRKTLEKRFKDPDDPLKIVIVRDMWLTGFDAPVCNTMYIDKPMQGHNLMQAIARVNRVFRNKSRDNGGLIVDYVGLAEELKQATKQYTNAGGKDQVKTDIEQVFQKMLEYIDIIRGQFATPVNGNPFDLAKVLTLDDPSALLNAIRFGANHILALDYQKNHSQSAVEFSQDFSHHTDTPRKKAFLQAVRLAKKGFMLCSSMPNIQPYRQQLAFFDAVRATIMKAENQGNHTSSTKEKQIKLISLLNQAVHSDGVVDLFELMGEERPDLSILSEDFIGMVKHSNTPTLWACAMEGYLKSEIRNKASNNIAMQKTFEEKLKEMMNQYNNHNLTVMEIIRELVELAKEIEYQLAKGEKLGLTHTELAFYDALIRNQSAVEKMEDSALILLAKEITDQLRRSVTIDWQRKEAVRAKMRVLIRRTLLKYKYPPDLATEAIEFVLKQAEAVAEELVIHSKVSE